MAEHRNLVSEKFENHWEAIQSELKDKSEQDIALIFYLLGVDDAVDRFEEILITAKLIKPKPF